MGVESRIHNYLNAIKQHNPERGKPSQSFLAASNPLPRPSQQKGDRREKISTPQQRAFTESSASGGFRARTIQFSDLLLRIVVFPTRDIHFKRACASAVTRRRLPTSGNGWPAFKAELQETIPSGFFKQVIPL